MKSSTIIIALCMLFAAVSGLDALGGREPPPVEASGRVRLVGSMPDTSLVLSGESREWYIAEKDQKKLMPLQQQNVTVRGTEYYVDLTFANGISAGRRYYLKDIKIIAGEDKPRR